MHACSTHSTVATAGPRSPVQRCQTRRHRIDVAKNRTPVLISNWESVEATTGFEPVIAVLQTTTMALLGDFRGSPRVQISQASGAVEGRELPSLAGLAVNLAVRLLADDRVRLGGQPVTVLPGELLE